MHKAWYCLEVPSCFSRSSVKFQGHMNRKIDDFEPYWAFPDYNSSLNSPMAMEWCTKLEAAWERCPIVFQGHPSNFKVTLDKKLSILTQIGCFRTITPVWIHWWIWNDAQTWSNIEKVPYCFSRSFIKFQGHTGWKIDDFNPIWVRLTGRSQLSNPSDLPCLHVF